MPDRPNILCIMSDEHDASNMGCYGDPLGATPTLDALAARGVTFDNCYCNSPLCVPSRLSFTASQYISRCGAWNNSCWLPSDAYPSLPWVLRAAGYEPYLCGKQHYDATRRYGFIDILPEISDSHRGSNNYRKDGRGHRRAADDLSEHEPSWLTWLSRARDFHAADHSWVLDHDRAVTHTARGFLGGRKRTDAPFFLFAGYLAPHFPLIAPTAYCDEFHGRTPEPDRPAGMLENLPLNYKHLRAGFGLVGADPQVERKGRDYYWALTRWFDDEVGKLLKALGDSDVADNTIVIYTSDHGENKGDHGLWWKNCMYDHGARVPLIVSWPARWAGGQRRTGVCSLVDLVQTIIDLAGGGGEAPEQMDGDSLVDYLDDADAAWKDCALSEYHGHNVASGFTMYRQGDWKYVYHNRMDEAHGPERELYHMTEDPKEMRNLAADPAQADRIAALHQAMVEELGEDPDEIEQRCRADGARGYERD